MSHGACAVCGQTTPGPAHQTCELCDSKAGLPPLAPPLRPLAPCARCGHHEIVRVRMRERTSITSLETNAEQARPMALTWALGHEYAGGMFNLQKVRSAAPALEVMFGLLEAYVCRACGATELFTRNAHEIPIHQAFGTELMVAPTKGAYR